MSLIRLIVCILIALCPATSFAMDSLTGNYVADNRPSGILFLALTQSGNALSGTLTITSSNTKGGTEAVVHDLVGSLDKQSIDLKSPTIHLNGSVKEKTISLSASSTAGYRVSYRFVAMSEDEYNKKISEWRQSLAATHAHDVSTASAKEYEKNLIAGLSRTLNDDVTGVKNTQIHSDLEDMKHAINDQQIALKQISIDMTALNADANVTPMTCSQAYETLNYDFNQTLRYDFDSTLGYSINVFKEVKNRLINRLEISPSVIDKTTKDANTLKIALKTSSTKLSALDVEPDEALKQVTIYQNLAADAKSKVPELQRESDRLIDEAKKLHDEAEKIVHSAQSGLNCK